MLYCGYPNSMPLPTNSWGSCGHNNRKVIMLFPVLPSRDMKPDNILLDDLGEYIIALDDVP